jgi:hypothetical protein
MKVSSFLIIAVLLLGSVIVFPMAPAEAAPTTYVSAINPATGDGNFLFTNLSPPPGGVFTVNITVTDVTNLAGWQVNLTFDPTLLTIAAPADVFLPPDHILNGLDPQGPAVQIDNTQGWVMWARAIGPSSPSDHFDGSGRIMCVKLTVIKTPSEGETLSCNLVVDRAGIYSTSLVDIDANDISFTEKNGYYEYKWPAAAPKKPWLEVSPPLTVLGEPPGPPINGTPKAFFTVDIAIKNVTSNLDLIGVQNAAIFYNSTLIRLNNPADPLANVSEGAFMNNPTWAPYGTTFIWVEDQDMPTLGINTISIGCVINPNTTSGKWNWPQRPSGSGILCTLHFEVLMQEAAPWEKTTPLDLEPLFPGEMFLNTTDGWIPYIGPYDGEIKIKGYVIGIPGDLNHDGKVDVKDLVLFVKAFGSFPGHPRWNPDADINGDNKVNIIDLIMLKKNFGKSIP